MIRKSTILACVLCAGSALGAQEFFVSPAGSDRNPGSLAQPFQTLARARDEVRKANRGMTGDIHVFLRGGSYPVTDTIRFTPEDSGNNGHRIIYQAFGEEVPVLNGAIRVTGWKPYKGGIQMARLDQPGKLRSLIVDGKRAYMASKTLKVAGGWGKFEVKQGEAPWARVSGSSFDGVTVREQDLPDLANAEDVEIMRNTKFNSHIIGIREIASEGRQRVLKFQQPAGAIALTQKWGGYLPSGPQTVLNALEFLDEPGEFYFDRKAKTLYYYPRDGEDMAAAQVFAPRVSCLVSIQGDSLKRRVQNLDFRGITFAFTEAALPRVGDSVGKTTVQAATWCVAFDDNDWHATAYRAYDTMQNAVTVSSAASIRFEDNVLKHIGNEGIGFINDVSDSSMVGNLCHDIGGGAIQIGHPQHVYEGDAKEHAIYPADKEGVCRRILVRNNVLYDMTTLFYGHAPITAYFGDGLEFLNNHIQQCNYSAVSLGWGWNNFDEISTNGNPTTICRNNKFNRNRIYDCMRMLHDGGALYTLGSQPDSEASGNYVKAATTHFQGVYHMDEGTAWYTGKDLVFEIEPNQDNFELNNWRRKHDNHFRNVYSTSGSQKLGAPNCTVTDLHVIPDANWPEEALAIIRAAGVEPEYEHLLKGIPDIVFEPKKRYDTRQPVITAGMAATNDPTPESEGGRYEAEQARLSAGAKVEKDHAGFTGSGYVGGFYNTANAQASFQIEAPEMGTYTLTLRYSAGHKDSTNIAVLVNDEKSEVLHIKSTGDWKTWANHSASVFLKAGANTVTLKTESKSPDVINLDWIQLSN